MDGYILVQEYDQRSVVRQPAIPGESAGAVETDVFGVGGFTNGRFTQAGEL